MSIRQLKKWLRKQGCTFIRLGGNHEIWVSPSGNKFSVPYGKFHPRLVHKISKQIAA